MIAFPGRAGPVSKHWCLALIFYGVAGILFSFRDSQPSWLATVIVNMLVAISVVMIHRGIWLMLSKRPPDRVYIITVISIVILFCHFTYIVPDVGIRVLIISFIRVPYFISAAYALKSSDGYGNLVGVRSLIYILIAGSAWYFLRGCFGILSVEWALQLRTGLFQGINFLIGSIGNIVITIALSRVEAEQAINHALDLANQLKTQSDGLEDTVKSQTRELRLEVAERKQAQYELQAEHQRLRLSEQRFFRTFDQAPIGAAIISLDGRYVRVNREFETITGYSQSELQKLTVDDITHPNDQAVSAQNAQRLLKNEIAVADEIKRYISKDKRAVWVHVSARIMRGDDREPLCFLPMVTDITDKRNVELALQAAKDRAEQALDDLLDVQNSLIHSEKMASLGRIVAGAAHEINTPLGVAVTIGSLLSDRFKALSEHFRGGHLRRTEMERFFCDCEEGYSLLLTNLQRSADLVYSLKQVAVDNASEQKRVFALEDCLLDTIQTISPIWRKSGHRIDVICQPPIEIDGYPGVISQIITNLVTNSVVHAFDQNQQGVICINADVDIYNIVTLRYSDNGSGISVQHRDKVFEPFFTTKRCSGSTGLGLHIIYNLVVGKLGGAIDISDNAPSGVVFSIRFPRTSIELPVSEAS